MRRFPFTLMLLPGGEFSGTVAVHGRAPSGGGFVVRVDGTSEARGTVAEQTIWSSTRILAATGVDLDAIEVA